MTADATAPSASVHLLPEQPPATPNCPPAVDYRCGIWRWRPRCLGPASNICAFLAAACFISFLQAAFSGYIASQVTTLEKRFAVGSSVIGIVNGFFEIGYIVSVIFVSYAGGRGHVPKVISIGLFIMATGAILWSLPHFVIPYKFVSRSAATSINPLCSPASNETYQIQSSSCIQSRTSGYGFLPMLFVAQLLIGSGSSPILTLIPPFIDDHVHTSKAPRMIAAQYASAALGPVFGFALGAFVLQYPHDLFNTVPSQLKPDDPNWIGAWWTGFILFGILVSIGGLVLLSFPRRLPKAPDRQPPLTLQLVEPRVVQENGGTSHVPDNIGETDVKPADDNNRNPTQRIPWYQVCSRPCSRAAHSTHSRCRLFESNTRASRFKDSVWSLVRNRVYLVVCLGICSEMFMVIGFASFLPKYLEMEYQLSKAVASIIAGGLIVPAGALGIFVGGLILQRFSFHRRDAIRFVLIVNLFIIGCIFSFFFLGCNNPPIAGLTSVYPTTSDPLPHTTTIFGWPIRKPHLRLTSVCNKNCGCDPLFWSPVCDPQSGVSFVSLCFAGCNHTNPTDPETYSKCSCVPLAPTPDNSIASIQPAVRSGLCPLRCGRVGYFIPVLTLCLFLTGIIQNPLIMVTMRSVGHQERSFALGLQFVIIRLLANLPSPMVFGRVIDEACLHWRFECTRRGDCAFVDVRALNMYMTCLGLAIKTTGFVFYIALLYLLRSTQTSQTATGFVRKPSAPLSGPRHVRSKLTPGTT